MIHYKSEEEIELIKQSSLIVAQALAEAAKLITPGVTTAELDRVAETYIRDHKGVPGFKGYNGFTGTLCTSINHEVVHGIPSDRELVDGDVVSLDCGVVLNGYFGDSAYTFALGEVDDEIMKLLRVTKTSLYKAIEVAVAGNRLGDIGHAVQQYAEAEFGYGIVRDLVGHGIGKSLHESPEVPNYGKRGRGIKLQEGLVIAIEPMVNLGTRNVVQESDGWTISTMDKKPSAHYEHCVAVKRSKAEVLTTFEPIEEAERNNENLISVELEEEMV